MQPIDIAWQAHNADDSLFSQEMHFHTGCEFMHITEGAVSFTVNDIPYTVSEGELAVIPAFVMHEVQALRNPYSRTCFRSAEDFKQLHYLPPELASLLHSNYSSPIHIFQIGNHSDAASLIERICREFSSPAPFHDDLMRSLFLSLLISLYRISPTSFAITDAKAEEYRFFIESNFREKISIEDIAAHFFISVPYFITKFKHSVGCSPHQYRSLCRIAHAKRLLCESQASLAEIADACGFTDANSFIRTFRKSMQITPAKYRERYFSGSEFPEKRD